jgi:hypothetical protein
MSCNPIVSSAVLVLLAGICAAQGPSGSADGKQDIREMVARASSLTLDADGRAEGLRVNATPLFRFNDAARETSDGTLWLWEAGSAPLAVLCLFHKSVLAQEWNYELTLLGDGPVQVSGRPGWTWGPAPRRQQWVTIDGPVVDGRDAVRLRQFKALAHEFVATEPEHASSALRLLPQPVHRYARTDGDVIDGTLFLFVWETNPEVVMQLEALGGSAPGWRASFGRVAASRLVVSRKGKPVWEAEPVRQWDPRADYYSHFGPDPVEVRRESGGPSGG